jgi:membrane peptidoglycan carboxypeptidase
MSDKYEKPEGQSDQSNFHDTESTDPALPALSSSESITQRQERARRYLERKQNRQMHIASGNGSQPMDHGNSVLPAAPSQNSSKPAKISQVVGTMASSPQKTDFVNQSLRWQRHKKLLVRHLSRKRIRQDRAYEQQSLRHVWLTFASIVTAFMVIVLSLSAIGSYIAVRFYNDTQQKYIPQVASLRDLLPRDNLKVYDSKGIFIGQLADGGIHTSVPLNQISPNLINATIAIEDKNFWSNQGIDILRIIQAALDNLRQGHVVEGGSTITQQLIKNLVVGNETSVIRKLEEIVLTPDINSHYTKSDIMEMYLNTIYYGEQAYGIDAAASIYFGFMDQPGKPASSRLDLAQSVILAGIPNSPDAFDPRQHPQASFMRFQLVLDALVNQQYITKIQALDAIHEEQSPNFFKHPVSQQNRAPHFFNFVLTQLEQSFHLTRAQLSRSDMTVTTTLDIGLQDKIQKIAQQHIAELNGNNLTNAAEVLIDFRTGAIRSLLGSIDYNNKSIDGEFDVATQGYRQPGSSFKPYVYVTAFEQGASPAQPISDEPTTIQIPDSVEKTFTPMNYDLRYHGHLTIRCALQNSLNIPAVRTLEHVGIPQAMKTAHDMGITSYEGTPGYSLVLGGLGVRLIDHTSAIGTFANNGVHVPYYAIEKVVFGRNGQTFGHPINPGTRVISPQLAYMMTNVLSDNQDRLPEFFDCNVLQLYSNSQQSCYEGNRGQIRPAAAKTGTTNDFRDNWTLGYTTDYVMGVWAGNDNNTPMNNVTGVMGAAPIWHDSMLVAEQGKPIHNFVNPGGLQWANVTYPDGVKTSDWFIPGTVPNFTQLQTIPTPAATEEPQQSPNVQLDVQPDKKQPVSSITTPYCPGDFSYATTPPGFGAQSPNPGWW